MSQTDQSGENYAQACLTVCSDWVANATAHSTALVMVIAMVIAIVLAIPVHAQDISSPATEAVTEFADQDTLDRLQSIGRLIDIKRKHREELNTALRGSSPDVMLDERRRLAAITQDLEALRTSFEHVLLDDIDTELMAKVDNSDFNWRHELVEIVEPLLNSLKSLTKRPRQLAELRNKIDLDIRRLAVAEKALLAIERVPATTLDSTAADRLSATREKWIDARNLVTENLMIARSQLGRLQNNEQPFVDSVFSGIQSFVAGRGLTLVYAAVAAILGWGLMRTCWHLFQTRMTKRSVRRKATWFRLLAYSYHLFTLVVVVGIVVTVLYLRQDVLLMGVAFLVLAVAVISLRTFLPRFLAEVRLLLNLGAVREEECVMHAGLPWQVMSLNILTVLRNPALEGVIRLPLDVMTSKVSRPTLKAELWFPTQKKDYILLPDRTFGQVIAQTPELVELSVKGGMSLTIPTADFYSMSVLNLSRNKTFGIAVTFGFDYSLQPLSLKEIPETLKAGVLARLAEEKYEYGKDISNVLVELASAGASSLDFLIYTNVSSSRAADFFAIERLVQQTCVQIANEKQWVIPFPQMTLHHQAVADESLLNLQRAA